jgi:hypothetical protein
MSFFAPNFFICKTWTVDSGLNWTGLDWTGLDWNGMDWIGMEWKGLG